MTVANHIHKWEVFKCPDKLSCSRDNCRVVTDINTLLRNTEDKAAHESRVKLLSDQLFRGQLKKKAHDEAYAWLMFNNSEPENAQGSLL